MGTFVNTYFFGSAENRLAELRCFFRKHQAKKGFTLVELLVVIAITAILTTIGITLLNPSFQIKRANDSKRKANVAKIQVALEQYFSDLGYYPTTASMNGAGVNGFAALTSGSPIYLAKSPNGDPKSSDAYFYTAYPSGCDNTSGLECTAFTLVTCLENASDPSKDTTNDASCTSPLWSMTVTNQ